MTVGHRMRAELVTEGGPESLEESGGSDAITGGPVPERLEMSHLLMTVNLKRAQVKQEQACDKPLEVGDDVLVLNPVGQSKQKVALALLAYNALNLMRSQKSNRHLIKTYMYRETVGYCTQAGLLAINLETLGMHVQSGTNNNVTCLVHGSTCQHNR